MAVPEGLLQTVQRKIGEVSVQQLLSQHCSEALLEDFCNFVTARRQGPPPGFGFVLPPDITYRFTGDESAWMGIRRFCSKYFADDIIAPAYLLDCLLRLYESEAAGAWVGPDATKRREPMLQYDSDGLVIGPRGRITFSKEGVLTDRHWLLYSSGLPGVGLSGGFLEALISVEAHATSTRHFGLAVKSDCILDRSLHYDAFTRAYIRGPVGVSEELLRDPGFPEDARGTVTVHQRIGDDPLYALFPLLRTEVMWSRRKGLKTVQIEELIPIESTRASVVRSSTNRYLHAIWDQSGGSFVHLDGALRTYGPEAFEERIRTDLRNYPGRACSYQKLFRIDADMAIDEWCDLRRRQTTSAQIIFGDAADGWCSSSRHGSDGARG